MGFAHGGPRGCPWIQVHYGQPQLRSCRAHGKKWALAPCRPLARVWRSLFGIWDSDVEEGPNQAHVIWMLAHTTSASVGRDKKSDDTWLTALDVRSNAAADALAKAAAASHRASIAIRAEIAATLNVTRCIAQYLGRATFAANHHPFPPHRDSAPTAKPRSPLASAPPRRTRPKMSERTKEFGGHDLVKGRHAWSCRICWASSRTRANLAHARCAGPAAARWAKLERQLCTTGVVVGPRHVRIMTDNIIWCLRCGHYAERFAVSLAKPCSGHPTSAGTRACRNRLSRFMHPRTKAPMAGPHFPESMHARKVLTGPEGAHCLGVKVRRYRCRFRICHFALLGSATDPVASPCASFRVVQSFSSARPRAHAVQASSAHWQATPCRRYLQVSGPCRR